MARVITKVSGPPPGISRQGSLNVSTLAAPPPGIAKAFTGVANMTKAGSGLPPGIKLRAEAVALMQAGSAKTATAAAKPDVVNARMHPYAINEERQYNEAVKELDLEEETKQECTSNRNNRLFGRSLGVLFRIHSFFYTS
jgi:hypothetical protein